MTSRTLIRAITSSCRISCGYTSQYLPPASISFAGTAGPSSSKHFSDRTSSKYDLDFGQDDPSFSPEATGTGSEVPASDKELLSAKPEGAVDANAGLDDIERYPLPPQTSSKPGDASGIGSTSRPQLPSSIKRLNRLLGRQKLGEVPEHELKEQFVRGSGPGGQAINKTSSSVSLIHLPTGVRVQAQPTRSREQNRRAARRILAEKLDLMIATGSWSRETIPSNKSDTAPHNDPIHSPNHGEKLSAGIASSIPEEPLKASRKETRKKEEVELAGKWSRQEIIWEKERRRKANRTKKSKRKKRAEDTEEGDEAE